MNGAPEEPAPEVEVDPVLPDFRIRVDEPERRVHAHVTAASLSDLRQPRREMVGHRLLDPENLLGVIEQVLEMQVRVEHSLRLG